VNDSVPVRILAACAAVALLRYASPVLLPIVLSVLLFYMLDPIVDRIERWRVPRAVGSAVVVLGLVGAMGTTGALLWPQVDSVLTKIPEGAAKLRTTFRQNRGARDDSTLKKVQAAAKALDSAAAEAGRSGAGSSGVMPVEVRESAPVSSMLWTGGVGLLGIVGQAITILFLTIFLLYENDSFKRKLVAQMETKGSKRVTVHILNDIARQIESFIWVQAITSTAVAVVTALVLWRLGVEEPAVWGLIAGVMNIVPYFGPLVVTVVLAGVAFLQFGTLEMAALVAGVALAITTFEGMFLTPHLLSRAASLNHVAIFLAIAFWSWAWGIPGMLLAVPMLMAMKAVCDNVEGLKAIGEFLAE